MPFINTWDAAFEAAPADSEDINLGANRIRALKVAIRERMQVDHEWEDDQQDGKHNKLTLVPQDAPPATTVLADGFLYTFAVSSFTELFYKDNGGNIIQFTQGGRLYPFANGDFSIAEDLAVANNAVIGETTSFAADFVTGFAAFATVGGDAVLQLSAFNGGSYLMYEQSTGNIVLVRQGAVVQTWS